MTKFKDTGFDSKIGQKEQANRKQIKNLHTPKNNTLKCKHN